MAQEKSSLPRTFFHRTNALAARLGILVQDLPDYIGISRRTLFECRSADSKVTGKNWAKLDEAEAKVRVTGFWEGKAGGFSVSKGNANQFRAVESDHSEKNMSVRDDPSGYDPSDAGKVAELEHRLSRQEARIDALERMLAAALDLVRLKHEPQ